MQRNDLIVLLGGFDNADAGSAPLTALTSLHYTGPAHVPLRPGVITVDQGANSNA